MPSATRIAAPLVSMTQLAVGFKSLVRDAVDTAEQPSSRAGGRLRRLDAAEDQRDRRISRAPHPAFRA